MWPLPDVPHPSPLNLLRKGKAGTSSPSMKWKCSVILSLLFLISLFSNPIIELVFRNNYLEYAILSE